MAQEPTELWSQKYLAPYKNGTRAFICPGYDTESAAILAVYARFGCKPGTQHPQNPALFATLDISARAQDGPTTWIVTVPYTYLTGAQDNGKDLEPLIRPTRWRIIPGLVAEESDVDAFGNRYRDSAGFPFPNDQRTFRTLNIIATRYYADFNIGTALKYMNKVNSVPIPVKTLGTVQKGQFKCNFIGPTQEITLSVPAPIEVEHHFEIRGPLVSGVDSDPAFRRRVLDAGRQGWYQDASNRYQPEDFSSPDPSRSSGSSTYYRIRSAPTVLNGYGVPLESVVKLGEGISPKTITSPPSGFALPDNVERKRNADGSVSLLFTNDNEIDFSPLIAGL